MKVNLTVAFIWFACTFADLLPRTTNNSLTITSELQTSFRSQETKPPELQTGRPQHPSLPKPHRAKPDAKLPSKNRPEKDPSKLPKTVPSKPPGGMYHLHATAGVRWYRWSRIIKLPLHTLTWDQPWPWWIWPDNMQGPTNKEQVRAEDLRDDLSYADHVNNLTPRGPWKPGPVERDMILNLKLPPWLTPPEPLLPTNNPRVLELYSVAIQELYRTSIGKNPYHFQFNEAWYDINVTRWIKEQHCRHGALHKFLVECAILDDGRDGEKRGWSLRVRDDVYSIEHDQMTFYLEVYARWQVLLRLGRRLVLAINSYGADDAANITALALGSYVALPAEKLSTAQALNASLQSQQTGEDASPDAGGQEAASVHQDETTVEDGGIQGHEESIADEQDSVNTPEHEQIWN